MLTLLVFSLLAHFCGSSCIKVTAHDANLYFTGRFLISEAGSRFTWAGSTISALVEGTASITAQLIGGKGGSRFLAIRDGQPSTPFKVGTAMKNYTLAKDLDASAAHTVELVKVSEDNYQMGSSGAAEL